MKTFKLTLLSFLFVLAGFSLSQAQITADFSWTPNPACEGQAIQFQGTSSNSSVIYDYSFGDGTWSYGPSNPTKTYATAGTYNVFMCVWDSLTQDSACISKQLIVLAGPCSATPDTISGLAYHDVNSNGTYDAGDHPLANQLVDFGVFQWATDPNGEYSVVFNAGTYTVSIPNAPAQYTLTSPAGGSYTITGTGSGQNSTADFAYTAPIVQDLCVTIQSTRFRPGFNSYAYVTVKNVGTTPMSGNAIMTYDANQSFVSSTPNTAIHTAANRTVDFAFTNLGPTQTFSGRVNLIQPTTLALGTPITITGNTTPLAGDAQPYNNQFVHQDTVIGSYDPNDKAVSPSYGPDGWVKPGERLFYLIRFQNTGTASAINVEVIDTMSTNLDMSTYDMISASHNYVMTIDADNAVHWRFDNINLPDSNSNEPASHGFIRFAVNPVQGLQDFETITNSASIYFDFNAPIITNTTLTTINSATSIVGELNFSKLDVFPNPATEKVMVTFDNEFGQQHVFSLSDMQGRTVRHTTGNTEQMELSVENLNPGFYLFRLIADDGRTATGKLVVK